MAVIIMQHILYLIAGVIALAFLGAVIFVVTFFQVWLKARVSGLPVDFFTIIGMKLRGNNPNDIIDALVQLNKAGEIVSTEAIETHILSGGNILAVIDALISASKANLDIDFQRIAALDLAGRDVRMAVNAHIKPIMISCPAPSTGLKVITGVPKDGIRLGIKANITVRTQLDKLVGNAGEATIEARVGEGIVAVLGETNSHKEILANPELISKKLLSMGLSSQTCFEILSIDIIDVDVMDNIKAKLRLTQAEADRRIARAKVEEQRALAVAQQQEMIARTTDMQSLFVSASSVEPLAVSSAFKEGNMGRTSAMIPTINARLKWKK